MDAFAWVCLGWALFASLVALIALGSFLQTQKELTPLNRHVAEQETNLRLLTERATDYEPDTKLYRVGADYMVHL